jgi:hypothetical protein
MKKVATGVEIIVGSEYKKIDIYVTERGDLLLEGVAEADAVHYEKDEGEILISFNEEHY